MELKIIARVKTKFSSKFGIPRQSGLSDAEGEIIFEPDYRNPDALKGIEEYSHLWILWGFSENFGKEWTPTVRPPRLGGNERRGVFATRSPFRPNSIGLSCVKLLGIEQRKEEGVVLKVSGVDMLDQTPVYDIKPYLPYVDAYTEAKGGFAQEKKDYRLKVHISDKWKKMIPKDDLVVIEQLLTQDPRPSYQNDSDRVYGMEYGCVDIRFRVDNDELTVCEICKRR